MTSIQPIKPEHITAASLLIRLAHPDDASLGRALDKAAGRVLSQPWRIDDGVLAIVSHSHPNEIRYATAESCDCRARTWCWHRACALLLGVLHAAGVALVPPLALPDMRMLDDLGGDDWPDSFLDGDFRAFDDAPYLAA